MPLILGRPFNSQPTMCVVRRSSLLQNQQRVKSLSILHPLRRETFDRVFFPLVPTLFSLRQLSRRRWLGRRVPVCSRQTRSDYRAVETRRQGSPQLSLILISVPLRTSPFRWKSLLLPLDPCALFVAGESLSKFTRASTSTTEPPATSQGNDVGSLNYYFFFFLLPSHIMIVITCERGTIARTTSFYILLATYILFFMYCECIFLIS